MAANSTTTYVRALQHCLLLLLLIGKSIEFCPSKCLCEGDHNLRALCINAGLEVVPIQLNPDVTYINLTLNQITNVHFTLSFYDKLEVLDVSQNKLDTLGSKNFEAQEKLRLLRLNKNSLIGLLKDAFRGLKRLRVLNLADNRIETVHQTAFHDLKNLVELDLTNNRLVSLEAGVCRHMVSLEVLSFQNNQLLDVPHDENLEYMKALQTLDLAGNLIENIRNDSFTSMRSLELLKLNGNLIMELDNGAFDGLSGLKYLDVADNNLTVVPTTQLSKLSNLSYLSLSGNTFQILPAVSFLNLFHLAELHLDRLDYLTKIDSRAFVDNTFLKVITLDDNPSYTVLPMRLFHGNPNLVDISMRRNRLTTLDAAQFPLDRLQRLRLADNPLVCNCSLLWLWRLSTGHSGGASGMDDQPLVNDVTSAAVIQQTPVVKNVTVLLLDKEEIGCDQHEDDKTVRRLLIQMSESDIKCPAHMIRIISAILCGLLVFTTVASILYYVKTSKRKKKIVEERMNVNERIVPQKVDKLELERYLAAQQQIANEYHTLRSEMMRPPWEMVPIKDDHHFNKYANDYRNDDDDHYEHFDYLDTNKRTLTKPHVVYV